MCMNIGNIQCEFSYTAFCRNECQHSERGCGTKPYTYPDKPDLDCNHCSERRACWRKEVCIKKDTKKAKV